MEQSASQTRLPQVERPGSLADFARRAIERAILAGEYRAGERLVEERLCVELGISRPPLREALQQLASTGIVEHRPRRGAWVKGMTAHDVFEIVSFRRELELMAMRLATPGLDPARVAVCRQKLDAMHRVADSGHEGEMVAAGFAFHLSVLQLAGHSRIEHAYRAMSIQLRLCMAMNNQARRKVEDLRGNVDRHEELFAVILTEDMDKIESALAVHGESTFLEEIDEQVGDASQAVAWFARYVRPRKEPHAG